MVREEQVTTLVQALHDPREGLRQFAIRRLVNIGPQVIPFLISALGNVKEYTQESAAIVLATIGKEAMPYLLDAMKNNPDRRVCWGAAWVLASLGPEVRAAVPPVAFPETQPETVEAQPRPLPADMWSDAWLTKVRNKLAAARDLDVFHLAGAAS